MPRDDGCKIIVDIIASGVQITSIDSILFFIMQDEDGKTKQRLNNYIG